MDLVYRISDVIEMPSVQNPESSEYDFSTGEMTSPSIRSLCRYTSGEREIHRRLCRAGVPVASAMRWSRTRDDRLMIWLSGA